MRVRISLRYPYPLKKSEEFQLYKSKPEELNVISKLFSLKISAYSATTVYQTSPFDCLSDLTV